MRFALLAAAVLWGCASPASWEPVELASVPALSFEPSTGSHPAEDLAMGLDGALLLPSPGGGPPIELRHPHAVNPAPRLDVGPRLDPRLPRNAMPGLGSLLWERPTAPAPFRPGVELYRSRQFKLVIGTRSLIDERYPDPVMTEHRLDPTDFETAAVVGLRLGF